ncbi:Golgi apparatus membrane protein tvp18 [Mortierella sp. AM989]|nr:Golgi apparatus membrane protein tvp18 [Mortierella sp. AM989]
MCLAIPFCLKCCPTSAKFDNFLIQFQNSYYRAAGYIVFAIILWIEVGPGNSTIQVINALLLTGGAISYIISALRHQTPASSTITGGSGVSTIV